MSGKTARLNFGDLEKVEFDGGFAAKNGDEDVDFAFSFVDILDLAQEVVEGAVGDFDGFANGEG